MSILVTVVIVILLLALAIWGTSFLDMLDPRLVKAIQFILVVIAILYIARAAGLA